MTYEPKWVAWARRLQAIAQTGLHFAQSEYDRQRYQEILDLSVEIFAEYSGEPASVVNRLFENQTGYATPKVDVRGVVFRDKRLLLVRERADGLWTLPGGWADVNDAPSEAVEREILRNQASAPKPNASLPCSTVQDTLMSLHFPTTFTSFLSVAASRAEKRQRQWKPAQQIFSQRTKFLNYPSPGSLPNRSASASRWRSILTPHQDSTRASSHK